MSVAGHNSILKNTLSGIGLTALISAVAISVPIIGFVCLLLLPQPIIFYRLKLGRRQGLMIIGAALLLIILGTGGLFADAVFLMAMMGLGFCMGEFIEQGLPVEKTIAYAGGAVIIAGCSALVIYANLRNISISGFLSDYIAENLQMTIALYKKTGMAEESVRALENSIEHIGNALFRILPSLTAAGLLLAGWLNLLAARLFLNRWQREFLDFRQLNLWQAPEALVWGVAASIGMLLLPSNPIRAIGINALVILVVIYFFQGIAVLSHYFETKRFPLPLRWIIYAFIVIQQVLMLVVAAIGFFDVWANFRGLETSPPDQLDP